MCISERIRIDSDSLDNSLTHAVLYKFSTWKELKKMLQLVNKGHEIKWSANERWCTINGTTFNISKSVYEKRVIESQLEDEFTEYHWNWDRTLTYANARWNDTTGCDSELIFDISVKTMDLSTLDSYLEELFSKK